MLFSRHFKMTEEERIPLKEPIFKELQAEDPDVAPTEVESMCVNCGENVSHLPIVI